MSRCNVYYHFYRNLPEDEEYTLLSVIQAIMDSIPYINVWVKQQALLNHTQVHSN